MNHITIQLDVATLNHLFPEGSEARIGLTKGVVANFVQSQLAAQKVSDEVRNLIDQAQSEATQAVLKNMTDQRGWGTVALSAPVREKLKEEAQTVARQAMTDTVKAAIEERMSFALATIKHDLQVTVNQLVDAEIRTAVKAKIQAAMSGALS